MHPPKCPFVSVNALSMLLHVFSLCFRHEMHSLYPNKFVQKDSKRFKIFNTLYDLPGRYIGPELAYRLCVTQPTLMDVPIYFWYTIILQMYWTLWNSEVFYLPKSSPGDQIVSQGHLTWRFSQVFPYISQLFPRFPNKSSKPSQLIHNSMTLWLYRYCIEFQIINNYRFVV